MPEAPTAAPAAQAAPSTVAPEGADHQSERFEVPENVSKLLENLGMVDGDATPGDEPAKPATPAKPKDAPKPKDGTAPDKPKDGAAPADEKPITVRKEKLVRPDLPLADAPKTPAADTAPFTPDPAWEKSLEESEREILEDAREAERLFPEKYKGLAARAAKFIKDHADLTAKEEFDDQDPKYQQWLHANQPKLSRKDIREIEEARVTQRVRGEYDGKLQDFQHQMFVRDHEPKILDEGRSLFAELSNSVLPDDIAKAVKADGFEKAKEVYGLELETAQNVLSVATDDIVEFRRITLKDPVTGRPLQAVLEKPPTGDPADPAFQRELARYHQHERLSNLVGWLNNDFKTKAPAAEQFKNGRWFVTRDEMREIRPDQRHRFWTFTNAELIERAKANVPASVREAIERRREQMKKLGWSAPAPKSAPAKAAPDAPAPVPTNAARTPVPAPVPAGGDVTAEVDARAKRLAQQLERE